MGAARPVVPILQQVTAETVRRENDLEHGFVFGQRCADVLDLVHVRGRVGERGIGRRIHNQKDEAFILDRREFL
jgi:hypothetical protein